MTNNMGQEVEALHFPARAVSGCLAMFSVAQSMSRVATGASSEWASTFKTNLCGVHEGVPRPAFLIVASTFGVLAHTILAVGTSRTTFVIGVVVSGIAFGMVWPLMVLIIGEVFGTVNHGANYMFFDGFTSAIGTLLISNFLASAVYESNVKDENDISCYGKGCFQQTHVIIAGLCCSCLVTSLGVLLKTSDVYGRPTSQLMHRRMTDELYGSPYRMKRKR
jgi:MFS family permease